MFCWHVAQPETKALTKEDKPGHQKSRSMMALVQKCPACPEVGGFMQGANKRVVGCQWYIHLSLKVEVAVLKGPVSEGRTRE